MERPAQTMPPPVAPDEDSAYQVIILVSWAFAVIAPFALVFDSQNINFRPEPHHLAAMFWLHLGFALLVMAIQGVLVLVFNLKRYATTKLSLLDLLFILFFPVAIGFGILALDVPSSIVEHQNNSYGVPFDLQGTVFHSAVISGRGGPWYSVDVETTAGQEINVKVSEADFHTIAVGSVMYIHCLKSEYGSLYESWTIEPGK